MNEYDVLASNLKVRYKGVFDFAGLMKMIHDWLVDRKFEYHEIRYKDKLDTPLGNELEINIYGEKKVTEYYQYFFDVTYHLWETRDVQVVVDGKQVKRSQGRIDVQINGRVVTDWQKKYNDHPWMIKFLDGFLFKRDRDLKHVDPFDRQLHNLNKEIKRFLKIESEGDW